MMRIDRRTTLWGLSSLPLLTAVPALAAPISAARLFSARPVHIQSSSVTGSSSGPEMLLRVSSPSAPEAATDRTDLIDTIFEQLVGPPAAFQNFARIQIVLEPEAGESARGLPQTEEYRRRARAEYHRTSSPGRAVRDAFYGPVGGGDRRRLASGKRVILEWVSEGHVDAFEGRGVVAAVQLTQQVSDEEELARTLVEAFQAFVLDRVHRTGARGGMVLVYAQPQKSRFHFRVGLALVAKRGKEGFTNQVSAPREEVLASGDPNLIPEDGYGLHGLMHPKHHSALGWR